MWVSSYIKGFTSIYFVTKEHHYAQSTPSCGKSTEYCYTTRN